MTYILADVIILRVVIEVIGPWKYFYNFNNTMSICNLDEGPWKHMAYTRVQWVYKCRLIHATAGIVCVVLKLCGSTLTTNRHLCVMSNLLHIIGTIQRRNVNEALYLYTQHIVGIMQTVTFCCVLVWFNWYCWSFTYTHYVCKCITHWGSDATEW